jgi:hypothetical protein
MEDGENGSEDRGGFRPSSVMCPDDERPMTYALMLVQRSFDPDPVTYELLRMYFCACGRVMHRSEGD